MRQPLFVIPAEPVKAMGPKGRTSCRNRPMEILQTAAPHPQLAAFVSIFAHRETSPGSSAVIQPVIASLEQTLTFELGDRPVMNFTSGRTIFHPRVYLIGARTTYQGATCLGGHLLEFGIFSDRSRRGSCLAFRPLNWLKVMATRRESWAHGSSNFGTNLPIVDHSLTEPWSRLRLCSRSPKPPVR